MQLLDSTRNVARILRLELYKAMVIQAYPYGP